MNTQQQTLSVSSKQYGYIYNAPLYMVTLRNEAVTIHITNLGCTVMSVYAPDSNGIVKNITAGFEHPADYANNLWYFGCIIGRYANRIAAGKFVLDGQTVQLSVNNDQNHLHGGFEGFHKKVWTLVNLIREDNQTGVVFEYLSEDGEEGYPGNLAVKVKYLLNNHNQLVMEYTAVTDKRTPVNFTNHSYFNLTGFEHPVIMDHLLHINAEYYTEKNEKNLPTGRILPLKDTPVDFFIPARIGDRCLDYNYVLNRHAPGELMLAAALEDPASGRTLRVFTDQHGMQVYTANFWDGTITGQQGKPYMRHGAIALETQAFPDSPNHRHFPDTVLKPGEEYRRVTVYEFGVR